MDPRITAALIIGAIIGLLGTMILACLIIDSEEDEQMWEVYNEVHNSRSAEGQATPEIQSKDGDDIHTDGDGRV